MVVYNSHSLSGYAQLGFLLNLKEIKTMYMFFSYIYKFCGQRIRLYTLSRYYILAVTADFGEKLLSIAVILIRMIIGEIVSRK